MSSMGPATQLITENRVDLQDILTTRVNNVLDHSHQQQVLNHSDCLTIRSTPCPVTQVRHLIDLIIGLGEVTCTKFLLKVLVPLRSDLPRLNEWMSVKAAELARLDATVNRVGALDPIGVSPGKQPAHGSSAGNGPRPLTHSISTEELFQKIRREMPTLVEALQGNLMPLLNEFLASNILTIAEIGEMTAKSSSQGGYVAASHLILRLLQKDHRISVPVWEALWKTRSTYQRLHNLLQDVFPDRA
nr:uncharacterized protein LOC116955424 isoform X2 [Petromyzon marinus]